MKKVLTLLTVALSVLSHSSLFAQGQDSSIPSKIKFLRAEKPIANQYIVVLREKFPELRVASVATELAASYGAVTKFVYRRALTGFSAQLSEKQALALSNDPRVDYVAEDGVVSTTNTQLDPPSGLDRIDQREHPLNSRYEASPTGAGVHVYVLDTGINQTHMDFDGRASIAADFVGDGQNGNDCNGHGTHVAGTIGGSTFGVAKDVNLHAVRVLDCVGEGSFSGVIAGVDWVTVNHASPAVANMSLGGGVFAPLDTAVRNSIASGVTYTIAAGNNNASANNQSPARVREAITVGATDIFDNRAWFSNFGSVVDIFAPGVDVTSAWIGSNTATNTISGTSMAAPHVAGVAALYLQLNPHPPVLVQQELISKATPRVVVNPGPGSPNRLLFSRLGSIYFADVTGDSEADAIVVNDGGVTVRRSNGGSFLPNESWITVPYFGSRGTFFADATGDGKADAIVVNDGGVTVRRSNGTSFLPNESWITVPYFGSRGTFFADATGDGKADAIVVNDGGVTVRRSNGTSFLPNESWITVPYFGSRGTFFADATGDGKADAIVVNDGGVTVRRSNGTSFLPNESWIIEPYFGSRGTFFADATGDGKADAIVVNDGGVIVRRSNGASFLPNESWITVPYFGSRGTFFADAAEDGKADAIVVNDGGVTVRRSNGTSFLPNESWIIEPYFGTR